MKAHDDFGAYGRSARSATLNQDRRPFRAARAEPVREIENARGLVIAVAMSAACWAAIALAFVL
jgi:hypothetical protein